jgi:uncharacterized membrane protein YfcA
MDTVGLLAAWVSIVSFLAAILGIVVGLLVVPLVQYWWAMTSKRRGEKRLQKLLSYVNTHKDPDNRDIADLVCLYGEVILTLMAAVAVLLMSLEVLDLGPGILAQMLPFGVDPKILTRGTGILMLFVGYLLIFRLSYLGVKLQRETRSKRAQERALREISNLRARLNVPA